MAPSVGPCDQRRTGIGFRAPHFAEIVATRPEKLVVRVDRTDPSKNIVRGFRAFELFLEQHPEALTAGAAVLAATPPESYLRCAYNSLHAYRFVDDAGGSRYVRYRWEPEAGEASLSAEDAEARRGPFHTVRVFHFPLRKTTTATTASNDSDIAIATKTPFAPNPNGSARLYANGI